MAKTVRHRKLAKPQHKSVNPTEQVAGRVVFGITGAFLGGVTGFFFVNSTAAGVLAAAGLIGGAAFGPKLIPESKR